MNILKNRVRYAAGLLLVLFAVMLLAGCKLELEPQDGDGNGFSGGAANEGVFIYYGKEILNGKKIEIVTDRLQRLQAVIAPGGGGVVWSSSNPVDISVDETGQLHTGKNPGRTAIITATSRQHPSSKAEVTFVVKGLR